MATTPVPQDVNNPYQYSQNGMPPHNPATNTGPYPSETLPPSGPPPAPHSLMGGQPTGTSGGMVRPPFTPTSSAHHHRGNGSAPPPPPPPMGHPPHGNNNGMVSFLLAWMEHFLL